MKTDNVKVAKTQTENEELNVKAKEKEQSMTLEELIPVWKERYGKIYKTIVDGESYIWRKIKRTEYVALMTDVGEDSLSTEKIYKRQEKITKMVVLYPLDVELLIEQNAGLATTIADEVIVKSGFEVAITEEL